MCRAGVPRCPGLPWGVPQGRTAESRIVRLVPAIVGSAALLAGCAVVPPEAVRAVPGARASVEAGSVAPVSVEAAAPVVAVRTPRPTRRPASATPSPWPTWTRSRSATPTPTALVTTSPAVQRTAQPVDPARGSRTGSHSGPEHGQYVVLSFDDCPKSRTAFHETLLAAEELGISLSLFPTGTCVSEGTFDPRFARAHGHYVFNHSVTHPHLTRVSPERLVAEIGGTGVQSSWGRPPYGDVDDAVRAAYLQRGMGVWLWDLDTHDWRGKSAGEVVSVVVHEALAADTVLMHMQWNGFSPDALARMTSGLAERGLRVCRNLGATEQRPVVAC